jgi:hypothetical protein
VWQQISESIPDVTWRAMKCRVENHAECPAGHHAVNDSIDSEPSNVIAPSESIFSGQNQDQTRKKAKVSLVAVQIPMLVLILDEGGT